MSGGSAPFWARRPSGGFLARWRPSRASSGQGGSAGAAAGGGAAAGAGAGPGRQRGAAGIARWVLLRVGAALAAIAVVVLLAGFLLARQADGPSAAWARSTGRDALWVGSASLDGAGGGRGGGGASGGVTRLAGQIRASGMDEVYVFAGQFSPQGNLDPPAGSRGFLMSLRAALPRVRVCAWLTGTVGGGQLNLDDAATRKAMVASAAGVLRSGFGGLQVDLAQVPNGDQGLLSLLGTLRALPALRAAPLSVTAPKLQPLPGLDMPAQALAGHPVFWTAGYLTQVASLVNQVAIMIYNTGLPFPSWYSGYVARETSMALRAVPPKTGLLIGVPAFTASNAGHHGSAETVGAAIHGIRVAVTATGHPRPLLGVGLFGGDGSATAADWSAYQSGWVHP
jgi:hypothetical protein